MDRTAGKAVDQRQAWGWLPAAMPGVARLMREKRASHGDAWCATCWKKGVIELQPDWFFAREGALAVGAPFADPIFANFAALQVTSGQALLLMRNPPGVQHGA